MADDIILLLSEGGSVSDHLKPGGGFALRTSHCPVLHCIEVQVESVGTYLIAQN